MKILSFFIFTLFCFHSISCLDENIVMTLSLYVKDGKSRVSTSLIRWLEAASTIVYPIHEFTPDSEIESILDNASGIVIYADPEDVIDSGSETMDKFKNKIKTIMIYLEHSWVINENDANIPIIVMGDADRPFLEAISAPFVNRVEETFKNIKVYPVFHIEAKKLEDSVFKSDYFNEKQLQEMQESKCIYLNTDSIIDYETYENNNFLKSNYKITSSFLSNNKRYILSMSSYLAQTHIEFIKFRPDIVVYQNLFIEGNFNTPNSFKEIRYNQMISEALSLRMLKISTKLDEEYYNSFFFKRPSTLDEVNKQTYYIFNATEPPNPIGPANDTKIDI